MGIEVTTYSESVQLCPYTTTGLAYHLTHSDVRVKTTSHYKIKLESFYSNWHLMYGCSMS